MVCSLGVLEGSLPETNVFLYKDHGDLTREGADVDEHVCYEISPSFA